MLHAGAELEVTGERTAAAETPMLIEEKIDEIRIMTSFSSRPPLPPGAKPAYAAQADARARRATRWDEVTLGLQRARQAGRPGGDQCRADIAPIAKPPPGT